MDAGHRATEEIAIPRLRDQLAAALPGVEFIAAGGF